MNFDALSSQFSFSIVVTLKFGHFTFERSLIFKFEMLAFLKFDCSKFKPSPQSILNQVATFHKNRAVLSNIRC